MGDSVAGKDRKTDVQLQPSLIDPVYQKFTKSILRALGSNEFYQFFMESIARADNEIQFSNRKEVKTIDPLWVDQVETALTGFQQIISLPRHFIREDELIVNVANARKTGQDVVRHLASHASLVENYDDDTGDVRPSRVLQKYREEDIGLYENRVAFTALEMAYHFVKIRHDALFGAMTDEFGAKLKVRSDMDSATEHVHMDLFLHIKNTESIMDTDLKNKDIFDRISRLYRMLGVFMNTDFARQMAKLERVRGTIHKTNILKKNPNYRAAVKLLEFLRSYDKVGYVIQVVEQNPEVDETFQRDIFHNVLFNYIVLKGYLEAEEDRVVPLARKPKQRALKPKFIKEIIEELTEDYDLPDVEIRKVLIEELTKEQLMQEEEEERRRLVEEAEKRRQEEEERLEAERRAEEERLEAERLAEEERLRKIEEAEWARQEAERIARDIEDRRRGGLFIAELDFFNEHFEEQLELRRKAAEAMPKPEQLDDFADAALLVEAEEQRKREEAALERARKREEKERQRLEEERLTELARLEIERQIEQQRKADEQATKAFAAEIALFWQERPTQKRLRIQYHEELEARELERIAAQKRRAAKRQAVQS